MDLSCQDSVDEKILRTRFSNYASGIAIDIKPDRNGLYELCRRHKSKGQITFPLYAEDSSMIDSKW